MKSNPGKWNESENLNTVKLEWQEVRQIVLSRDNHRCTRCNEDKLLNVHHLIPKYLGGSDNAENLITLCSACHALHHPTLQVALSRPFIERWAFRIARLIDFSNEIPTLQEIDKINVVLSLLGKDRFRDGQLEVVISALRGESMLVVRPTGSGKSLCFQIPAIITNGTAYIFSPLKALMVDQSIGIQKNKIPSTFINSDLTIDEKKRRYQLLAHRTLKFLFLTPERFDSTKVKNLDEIEALKKIPPNYMVIDEAHCVDRWGKDFRPSYGRMAEVRMQLGKPPTLAFTATAGVATQKRILKSLGIPDAKRFISDVDRPNIALIRHQPNTDQERNMIAKRMIENNVGKSMIFVPTVKVGENVSKTLDSMGLKTNFYHSKLNTIDRDFLLGRFSGRIKPEINNIICTNAFGMGIDIANVHLVIHWVQPETVEDYLQEFGRAGRDGKPSIALIFKSNSDTGIRVFMAKKTAEQAKGNQEEVANALEIKIGNIDALDKMIRNRHQCFRKEILDYFIEKKEKKKSLAMRIIECFLCKKSEASKSSICCDYCNPSATKKLLKLHYI